MKRLLSSTVEDNRVGRMRVMARGDRLGNVILLIVTSPLGILYS